MTTLNTLGTKASAVFEEKIKRICDLLADSGAEVKWNDHISDPDNPAQGRQIDVTIKQAGVLTLVECRRRKSRQDVQWIEQLIGRRVSLGAQVVFFTFYILRTIYEVDHFAPRTNGLTDSDALGNFIEAALCRIPIAPDFK